jgi:hypothetical protein
MCNANPSQKPVLNTINSYSLNEINTFLRKGFELNCMLKYGINSDKLNALDMEIVKEHVMKESISRDALIDAGMHKSRIDEIFGMQAPPNISAPIGPDLSVNMGAASTEGYASPGIKVPSSGTLNEAIIQRIRNKKISVRDIQDSLLNEEITEQQLIEQCALDARLVERIKSYSTHVMPPIEFEALPALQPNRTDFYFLGLPSAGKTCLIASLLSHWLRSGICNQEVKNQRSIQYFKILGGGFSRGILPVSTPNAFIDYIELTLKLRIEEKSWIGGSKVKTYDVPINVLDMAGEKFRNVADEGKEKFDAHKKYLLNKNPKSIFFVLDYSVDQHGENTFEQSFSLQVVLNNLHAMGILDQTDTIYVVVTKADMFDKVSPDKYAEFANQYVEKHYASFKNTLSDLSNECGFEYEVLPYSIGPCVFGQLLEDYNPETNQNLRVYPESLSERIFLQTAKFKKGLGGIFSN